jgi:hypothetical protein
LQCKLGKFSQITRDEADALMGKTASTQGAPTAEPQPTADPAAQPSNDAGERSSEDKDRDD